MLSLNDPRWASLPDAYLTSELPGLLHELLTTASQLEQFESEWKDWHQGPSLWGRVWSLVYHQGTLYPATIAAFPYMVRAVERLSPQRRFHWLVSLAEIEAMRAVGALNDPNRLIDISLEQAYHHALQKLIPLATETLSIREELSLHGQGITSVFALLAFAGGDECLGFILARWWPYAIAEKDKAPIPVAALAQYEEMTGKRNQVLGNWTLSIEETEDLPF